MTTAQEILCLIETVDPSDTAKLDEIDYATYKFMTPNTRAGLHNVGSCIPRYTRSRDALRSIRPNGVFFQIAIYEDGTSEIPYLYPKEEHDITLAAPQLPTEELAELHAIIQAIEFERNNK